MVTNGHWVGVVIHEHKGWSWVEPRHLVKKDEDGNHLRYPFGDGPLTFKTSDLSEFK